MARLHSETIPTSTLASTARVVDGFVTTQTDHQGITESFTRAYTAAGITRTAKDGIWYTYGWNLTKKAPDGCKGDCTNTQLLPLRGELLTLYTAVAGFLGARKGRADLCKGIMNASGTLVITMGISASGFSILPIALTLHWNSTTRKRGKQEMCTYLN